MSEARRRGVVTAWLLLVPGLCACGPAGATASEPGVAVEHPGERVRMAVIGDYGLAGPDAEAVAELVRSWSPDLVITLGDNNYPDGRASTIDENVGQYYHSFIAPYVGRFGPGADTNRFFPSLGNHDWRTPGPWPHLDYFTLPGNERYYELQWGPLHLFAVDSDPQEPDGNTIDSEQARWLREHMSASALPWQVVYMHHPPYSSGDHGSSRGMRWPFAQWGADVVMSGHDHHYERIERDGLPYFVNGLGGNPNRYSLRRPVPGSMVRFRDAHGAMLVEATPDRLELRFVTVSGEEIDSRVITRDPVLAPVPEP
ncbi:MAG: metallophosphoesterase [Myxococcales bacterium]|nr:metallophosphoesterase [Myxococcales bacterium]